MTNEIQTRYEGDPIRSQYIADIDFTNGKSTKAANTRIQKALIDNGCIRVGDLENLVISADKKSLTFNGNYLPNTRISVKSITAIKDTRDRIFGTQDQKSEMNGFAASDFKLTADPEIIEGELQAEYQIPEIFQNTLGYLNDEIQSIEEQIVDAVDASSCQILFLASEATTLKLCFSNASQLANIVHGLVPQKLANVATEIRDDVVTNETKKYKAVLKTLGTAP